MTIIGATGNQGGSTLSAVLNNPTLTSKYKIRAITRDPSKPSVQSLASQGAELAQADLNDIESVKKGNDTVSSKMGKERDHRHTNDE